MKKKTVQSELWGVRMQIYISKKRLHIFQMPDTSIGNVYVSCMFMVYWGLDGARPHNIDSHYNIQLKQKSMISVQGQLVWKRTHFLGDYWWVTHEPPEPAGSGYMMDPGTSFKVTSSLYVNSFPRYVQKCDLSLTLTFDSERQSSVTNDLIYKMTLVGILLVISMWSYGHRKKKYFLTFQWPWPLTKI